MKLTTILSAISMLLGFCHAGYIDRTRNEVQYDIGIALSSGYGTISAHLGPKTQGLTAQDLNTTFVKNCSTQITTDSYVDIAKIEGSTTYKTFMLGQQNETQTIISPKFCPFSDAACQYWPIKTTQPVNPLAPILEALITAAESHLDTSINSLSIVSYNHTWSDAGPIKQYATSALKEMGVTNHDFLDHSARAATYALDLQGSICGYCFYPPCTELPEQLILSVDSTKDSLSAVLWTEECQVMREWKSAHLVHDNGTIGSLDNFKSALHRVCDPPTIDHIYAIFPQKPTGLVRRDLGAVILMGENAGDSNMRSILREVLKERFDNGHSVDILRTQDLSNDLAFVGARAAAASEGREYWLSF